MQKPTGSGRRHADARRPDRLRATATSRLTRLTGHATRGVQRRVSGRAAVSTTAMAAALRPLATAERALPIAVAAIVAVAALLAFMPNTPQGAVGGVQGSGTDVRYAVNGGIQRDDPATIGDEAGSSDLQAPGIAAVSGLAAVGMADPPSFQPFALPTEVTTQPEAEQAVADSAVTGDGTLLTGYAPLTTVEDGADLVRTYKVKSGDTLVTIASQFKVSMMTLWWANRPKLKTKDDLHIGQTLRIPPVSGLVYTVKSTDTLASLASTYKVSADRIVKINGLADPTLVVGQVLVLPGAKGAPIPTPKPTPKPKSTTKVAAHRSSGGSGPTRYTGGRFRWPVVGGNNYVSQYFHYGHWAIDIAADYGARVVAAAGGRVTFAGWKSNGGGYQVWISHGNGLSTTYNHMSGVSVGRGQLVGRGQQVGHVGQSGNATGPHLHFEVWKGPVWNGGNRVNPLRYF